MWRALFPSLQNTLRVFSNLPPSRFTFLTDFVTYIALFPRHVLLRRSWFNVTEIKPEITCWSNCTSVKLSWPLYACDRCWDAEEYTGQFIAPIVINFTIDQQRSGVTGIAPETARKILHTPCSCIRPSKVYFIIPTLS